MAEWALRYQIYEMNCVMFLQALHQLVQVQPISPCLQLQRVGNRGDSIAERIRYAVDLEGLPICSGSGRIAE
jgi:hypothetical protein